MVTRPMCCVPMLLLQLQLQLVEWTVTLACTVGARIYTTGRWAGRLGL
jgi:hypothetical protein